jgi:hypothetical protein
MFAFNIILILVITNLNILNGLKTSDLCLINTANTSKIKCFKPHLFICDQKYCSVHKDACNDFNDLNTYIKSVKNIQTKAKFVSMVESIRTCIKSVKKWKTTDICIKSDHCLLKEYNLFIGTKYYFVNNSKICPCGNKHPFKCDGKNNYCGLNKKSCDGSYQAKNIAFHKCGNFLLL